LPGSSGHTSGQAGNQRARRATIANGNRRCIFGLPGQEAGEGGCGAAPSRRTDFAELFVAHLLSRNIRIEEDLVDQWFNSIEKGLARVLLLPANFGKESQPDLVIPKISQKRWLELLAQLAQESAFS
jgi:hypothetical protein